MPALRARGKGLNSGCRHLAGLVLVPALPQGAEHTVERAGTCGLDLHTDKESLLLNSQPMPLCAHWEKGGSFLKLWWHIGKSLGNIKMGPFFTLPIHVQIHYIPAEVLLGTCTQLLFAVIAKDWHEVLWRRTGQNSLQCTRTQNAQQTLKIIQ